MAHPYSLPAEVRPLLGNLAQQRTDAQINIAIQSADDQIDKRTGRMPPNEWENTEEDFGIVQKLSRYIAALEMSIGIQNFEDRDYMMKEIEGMFMTIEAHDPGGAASNDFVYSSTAMTYASSESGLIWSTRYKNLRKNPSPGDENSMSINPDT